ncbi:PREDICTED: oral-facial-digital syndrome 1 protein [Nanorana parkeri]|uniref:oral-facial-digital syndrome 1 protein n=1 Tax=Nanorana parkeri TaxID=125878 RepID=UPI0008540FDA|nr:PREDICTED: oral-facial-digital syndrome 1 protein [Nanorana parkeri]
MMSHSENKSQEELRNRLYQTFKNKGVLDSLKTQLRNQLFQDLKHHAYNKEQLHSDLPSDSLVHRACNSLVADHMRRCGYEYSLSVFFPESGLEKEKALNMHDLMQLMKINPNSRLYKSLTSSLQSSDVKGFLVQILTELIDHHLSKDGRDADTQTVTTSPYKESIVEKLKFIDEQFDELYPQRPKFESLEGKLNEYRREIEEQHQEEMTQKLKRFKDVEIAKIKLEERDKCQKEISDLRRELEKMYHSKMEGLVTREKNAIERLQRQQEIESTEVYAQRQSLLKEIEVVRSREIELRQRMEAFELGQRLQEEKNKTMDDFLRKRELEVKNIEDTFNQKLKNELLRFEIELKEEYIKKSQKVNEDEKKNREEAARLREDTIVISMKKQELEQAISRTKHLEMEVDTLRAQLSTVTRQNHHVTDKLKEFADYPLVQEEKVELQAQVKLLKQQLEDLQKESHILRERSSHPSAEFLSLQEDLKRMEATRKFDQDEFKIQREILERQLELEMERGLEMKMQLLNREESLKRLNVQVDQLDFQLRQTQQAFESVHSLPRATLADRSVLDFHANKHTHPDTYVDKPSLRNQRYLDSVVNAGGIANQKHRHLEGTRSSSPDSDLEFVANTRARIKELEKEAELVEEAFRNYQHRVIHAAAIPALPSRGLLNTVTNTPQHRVTFLEDNLTPQDHVLLNRIKTQKYERLLPTEVKMAAPQTKKSSRRLSSTPVSRTEINHKEKVSVEDNDGSYITSSHHSPNHRLSPIPKIERPRTLHSDVLDHGVEDELELTPRDGQPPFENEDTRDHSKPATLHSRDLNFSDSSLQDQEDIPEQLESDLSHPSEDSFHDIRVTADVPVAATSVHDSSRSEDKTENLSHGKRVEEIRQNVPQEGKVEDERKSLEILEKSDSQQEISVVESKTSQEEQEEVKSRVISPEQENTAVKRAEENLRLSTPEEDNPLNKYMQLLLQNRAEQPHDKVTKESVDDVSLVEKLSNGSITAHSMGEADEDSW